MATDVAPIADLPGVETIIGSIIVANNTGVTTITGEKLTTVTEKVVLDNLPHLANITLPLWSSVGTMVLSRIPLVGSVCPARYAQVSYQELLPEMHAL